VATESQLRESESRVSRFKAVVEQGSLTLILIFSGVVLLA
jgi:hypothetical protein